MPNQNVKRMRQPFARYSGLLWDNLAAHMWMDILAWNLVLRAASQRTRL